MKKKCHTKIAFTISECNNQAEFQTALKFTQVKYSNANDEPKSS